MNTSNAYKHTQNSEITVLQLLKNYIRNCPNNSHIIKTAVITLQDDIYSSNDMFNKTMPLTHWVIV